MPTCLFADDAGLARRSGVVRRVHACRKLPEPVISGREPWQSPDEDERVYCYGTVLPTEAGSGYRMWYNRFCPLAPGPWYLPPSRLTQVVPKPHI